MKALILNSGTGSRMKGLDTCKCLVELADNVTIFDAQIQSLLRCGIKEFVITTGAHAEILEVYAVKQYPNACFTFVHNPLYSETNYIYSIYLAREHLRDDILLLHGDLVFEQNVLQDVIASSQSVMVIDSTQPLPEKDFKAVVLQDRIRKVSVDTFSDAVYAQPLYKMLQQDWELWLDEIERFCVQGETGVYAENAFNNISDAVELFPLDVMGRMCFEVDNNEDLAYAVNSYKLMPDRLQTVYAGYDSRDHIKDILADVGAKKPFIVCGLSRDVVCDMFPSNAVIFDGFTSNPDISEIIAGISTYEEQGCDFIVSIGGGSAIDVAKCIAMLDDGNSSKLRDAPRGAHLAIPTTAGTGSESTCFAVVYIDGQKVSYEHQRIMPDYVILDPEFLSTLPIYHKKSALLDALCQAIESLWAKGQTSMSRAYAVSAISSIRENIYGFLDGDQGSLLRVLYAANLAGKAINVGKTTAAHAMSYRLSTLYGIAHGHAVALCLPHVWMHLIESEFSPDTSLPFDHNDFIEIYEKLELSYDFDFTGDRNDDRINELASSVNVQRLGNHPIVLSEEVLADLYYKILCGGVGEGCASK